MTAAEAQGLPPRAAKSTTPRVVSDRTYRARSVAERRTSTSAKEGGPEFTVIPPKAVGVVDALVPLTTPTPLTAMKALRVLAVMEKPTKLPPPVKLAMEVQVGVEVLPGREGEEAE